MKKTLALVAFVTVTGGMWWSWSPHSQEAAVGLAREGVISPAPSARIEKLALEVKALHVPANMPSVEAAKTQLKKAQKDFKAATEEYNKKSMQQNVTNEDEEKYQVHMKKSHAAFLEYQQIVFNELKLTKEI
jgi:hypothetical protein